MQAAVSKREFLFNNLTFIDCHIGDSEFVSITSRETVLFDACKMTFDNIVFSQITIERG